MVTSGSAVLHDVALVEFHDAVVERVEVTRTGNVCVEFSHLAIYRRESVDTFGVWSFRAEFRLAGVEAFAADGATPGDEADTLEDARVLGSDGNPIDSAALGRGESFALGELELRWALSGARVAFRGGTISLKLLEQLERIEAWTGELKPG